MTEPEEQLGGHESRPAVERLDEWFTLLADRERRHLLYCLQHSPSPIELSALVACVASFRGAEEVDGSRVRTRLHHSHLPRLAETGLVEYDSDAGLVTVTSGATISALLEPLAEFD